MSMHQPPSNELGISPPGAIRPGRYGASERMRDALAAQAEKAKSVIQIFLWGGMSHSDTWDPKPDAGYDYTGEFNKVIPTNVDGIHLGSLFAELAKQADKFSIIRSITHRNNGHETAAYLMQTGHTPGERLAYKGLIPPSALLRQPQAGGSRGRSPGLPRRDFFDTF